MSASWRSAGLRRLGHPQPPANAEQPPASVGDRSPRSRDQALLVAIEADLEASPWEGEGYRKVWARLRVCRDIRVAAPPDAREQSALDHRCRRRGGNPHDGEIITHAPPHVGHRWRSGVHGGRRLGLDLHRRRAVSAGNRFAVQPISMRLAGPRPRPARLGGWPCGWITAPVSVGPRRSSSGASSRPTPSSPSPRPTASPSGQSHAEGTDHPWSHLPQHRRGTPSATSSNSTMPSGSEKNGYLSPAHRQAWPPRSQSGAA